MSSTSYTTEDPKDVSVKAVLEQNYYIPEYQRGYRWDDDQVQDLINDINDFYNNNSDENGLKNGDDYYCVQSLIIHCIKSYGVDSIVENRIVDGQQRLTTFYIIASFFNYINNTKNQEPVFKLGSIDYETRNETKACLISLGEKGEHAFDLTGTNKSRDIYFIEKAFKCIQKMSENNRLDHVKELLEKDRVKFIVQKYNGGDEATIVSLFESINTGKIPLKDSELIRAKLLLKCKESDKDSRAKRWDRIEHTLQDDSFWYFIHHHEKEKKDNKSASRIDYLFYLLANELISLEKNADEREKMQWLLDNTDEKALHSIYRFFTRYCFEKIDENTQGFVEKNTFESTDATELFWLKVTSLYEVLYKWFKDVELYNYTGQVMHIYSNEKTIIIKLYNQYLKQNYDKFVELLKILILRSFGDRNEATKGKQDDPFNIGINMDRVWPLDIVKRVTAKSVAVDELYGLKTSNSISLKELFDIKTDDANSDFYDFDMVLERGPNNEIVSTEEKENGNKVYKVSVKKQNTEARIFKKLWYSGRVEKESDGSKTKEDRAAINYFLLWSNCEYLNRQFRSVKNMNLNDSGYELYKFPFDIYKTNKPDIEHVNSYVDVSLEDVFWDGKHKDDRDKWFKSVYEVLSPEEKKKVQTKRRELGDKDDALKELKSFIVELLEGGENALMKNVKKDEITSDYEKTIVDVRMIGNLTILDKNINRGYGNSPFRVKRHDIINKEREGRYVYPCTKMVFLKEFDSNPQDLTKWNESDFLKYRYYLAELFVECFCTDKGKNYNEYLIKQCTKPVEI